MEDIDTLIAQLQNDLARDDLITRSISSSSGFSELLILKRENLKLKIYQEPSHPMPHIHVDYGKVSHTASYSIDPAIRLVGQLDKKYDRSIIAWIQGNKEQLLTLWEALQEGSDPHELVAALQGDT